MKFYISGKLTNGDKETPDFTPFHEAERLLHVRGITEIFNPADYEEKDGQWEYYIARDMKWIMDNRPTMYMLPNWKDSLGARTEHELAKLIGLDIEYA